MIYQWHTFGDPIAFAKAQANWRLRIGETDQWQQKLASELILKPIWEAYIPTCENFWAQHDRDTMALLSMQFANAIYFVGTAVLVATGWRKKWLNDYEVLLSVGLLLIPYVTKSHDNAMASFGRFSAMHGRAAGPLGEEERAVLEAIPQRYDLNRHFQSAPHAENLPAGFIDRFAVVGSPARCVDRLATHVELGVDQLHVVGPTADAERDAAGSARRRFREEVLPALRS